MYRVSRGRFFLRRFTYEIKCMKLKNIFKKSARFDEPDRVDSWNERNRIVLLSGYIKNNTLFWQDEK